jgi:outer membrane lipoprotein carrier protein
MKIRQRLMVRGQGSGIIKRDIIFNVIILALYFVPLPGTHHPLPITYNLSPIGVASAATLDEIVDSLQQQLASVTDIKGSFAQTSYIKDIEQTQKYSGTFFIKKPSDMMWEYSKPRDEKVVISSGNTWIYKKSENQVIKTNLSKKSYSKVPIAMLASFENIRDDYDISIPEKNALQLIPKHDIGFIKTIVMELVKDNFPIKMFTVIDTYGNIIMIELSNISTNSGLDDELFVFKIPPGAEVYDLNK